MKLPLFTAYEVTAMRLLRFNMFRFVAEVPERVRGRLYDKGAILRGSRLGLTAVGLAAIGVS